MKIVAFAPIKMNSERVPGKNVRLLGEHPLCFYALNEVKKISIIDKVYVYCSNPLIKEYLPNGIHFLKRSKKLDTNKTKGLEIYKSFVEKVDADIYILIHVTSPFLKADSLQNALINVINNSFDSAFSAKRIQTFSWFKEKPINYSLLDIPRTQDIEPVFYETSSFYIFKKEIMKEFNRRIGFKPFVQEVDDFEAVDIDEETDFEFATVLMKIKENNK